MAFLIILGWLRSCESESLFGASDDGDDDGIADAELPGGSGVTDTSVLRERGGGVWASILIHFKFHYFGVDEFRQKMLLGTV